MDPDEARELIDGGETLTVEFKEGRRSKLTDGIITDAVVCLANGSGGLLFLGVSDSGSIRGLEPRHGDVTHPHRIDAMILGTTVPSLATKTELLQVDGVEIAIMRVPNSPTPVGTSGGKYLRRSLDPHGKPQCPPYPLHEMLSAGLTAQSIDFAQVPARGATASDLDPVEFDRFRRLCARPGGDPVLASATDAEVLSALRLIRLGEADEITLGAVLLFGKKDALEKYLPNHEILFDELERDRVRYTETARTPLFQAAERLEELIAVRNAEQELIMGLLRMGVSRVPAEVVRECIANALVHRDYTARGAVRVQLDEAEFRVSSPGGFPPGVTLENLLTASVPRSPILADAFKRVGIVDRAGRGVREMYDHLLRAGRGIPDYTRSSTELVEVVVPAADADLEFVRFVVEFEDSRSQAFHLDELRVLHELKEAGPQSVSELADALDMGAATLRSVLRKLGEAGLADARGAGRNRRHALTAAFYRTAQASEYVRMQDTDPIQQAQMVLDYVTQFGAITRSKAADLCRITPQQASVLLQRMARSGKLEMHGERRGARYELPAG